MIGPNELLLGVGVPLAAAAAMMVVAWLLTRRAAFAWTAGVLVGFAAGAVALDAPGRGVQAAALGLVRPHESHQWLPMAGVLAALPAAAGWALGRVAALRWVLAAFIATATPLWLLWGGKYLPSAALREAGFTKHAWSAGTTIVIIGGIAAAILAAWAWWEAAVPTDAPRVRSLLTIVVLVGAAAAAALTGSLTHGLWLGALAAAIGGCAVTTWLLRVPAGPEAAAGPIVLIAGCLVMLAVLYSELKPTHAAGLWLSLAWSAGWLPRLPQWPAWGRTALRVVVCLAPLLVAMRGVVAEHRASPQALLREAGPHPSRIEDLRFQI